MDSYIRTSQSLTKIMANLDHETKHQSLFRLILRELCISKVITKITKN